MFRISGTIFDTFASPDLEILRDSLRTNGEAVGTGVLCGSIALSGIIGSVGESRARCFRKRELVAPHKDATAIAADTAIGCQCLRAAP